MKKVVGVVLGLCLLIVFSLMVWSRFPQKESVTAIPDEATADSHPPDSSDSSFPIVDTYRIVEGQKISPSIGKGTSAYTYVYPKKHLWVYGHAYAPANLPRLEIRFRKPSSESDMESCMLLAVGIEAWRNGGENMAYRTEQELLGRTFKQRKKDGTEFVGGKAMRTLITDDIKMDKFQGLYMGRMYYLYFNQLGFESKHKTPDKWGSCLLRVPEEVPPGKVAVMEVDVTQKINPYQVEMHTVRVQVNGKVPGKGFVQLAVPAGRTKSAQLNSDGSAEIRVEELGGEIAVLSFQRKDVGHLLYYKREVLSEKVKFPQDADIAVSSNDVLNFRLEVPPQSVPFRSQGLVLLMHRDSSVPVAGMEFAEVEGWNRNRDDQLPESVPLLAPPGGYYVAYDFKSPTIIGKVELGRSDADQTLKVEPLEE